MDDLTLEALRSMKFAGDKAQSGSKSLTGARSVVLSARGRGGRRDPWGGGRDRV